MWSGRLHQTRPRGLFIPWPFLAACAAILVAGALPDAARATWLTLVDGTSFNSTTAFTAKWSYDYPWGTDHNGSARMNATNVIVTNGMVTLFSYLTNVYEGMSSASPNLTIRYNSGTFYLKQQININAQTPVWDISGQFKVPTQTGTWPAFWMTGANSWPPESDFMEFKGNSGCSQNTYNGSWQTKVTTVSTAGSAWHTYRVVANLVNSTNVDFHYYIDGTLASEQTSTTFVGSPCWLIIDYQMEGSSGAPGPSATTETYVSNIVVRYENVAGAGTGAVANGPYKMLVRSSGQALDVGNQNTTNNSPLDQWPYNAGFNQQWTLTHLGGGQYSIFGRQSGRALQVSNSSANNGAGVSIADYASGANQRWSISATSGGYYDLMNVNSGKLLEVSDNSMVNFATVDQWADANKTRPRIASFSLPGGNAALAGSNAVPGVAYSLFDSPDPTLPGTSWTPIASVVPDKNGNFTSSGGNVTGIPQLFYQIGLPINGASNQQWTLQAP